MVVTAQSYGGCSGSSMGPEEESWENTVCTGERGLGFPWQEWGGESAPSLLTHECPRGPAQCPSVERLSNKNKSELSKERFFFKRIIAKYGVGWDY